MNALALLVAGTFFMEFLDGSIVTTALPHIASSFGMDPVALNSVVSVYLVVVAIFILPSGWMADKFGPRRVFTGAIVLFTASSILCGISRSAFELVASRALQGVAGAMMVPVGRLVVLRETAKADLMKAIAILTWPALTAPLLGPPLGGFLSEYLSWHWIFLVNVPLGFLGVALALKLVPPKRALASRPFDPIGFSLAGTLCVIVMSLIDESGPHFSAGRLATSLIMAAPLTCALAIHLRRHHAPIVDRAPLAFVTFRATLVGGTLIRTLIGAVPFLLPLMFQLGFGFDSARSGLLILPLFLGNIAIKPATSAILRFSGFRAALVLNGFIQALTMAACAFINPAVPFPIVVILLFISGASRSLQFTSLNSLAFADVPQDKMAAANTLFSVAFQASLGFGVTFGAALIRAASITRGDGATTPILADFRTALLILAALTMLAALNHARLPRDAGAAVTARQSKSK